MTARYAPRRLAIIGALLLVLAAAAVPFGLRGGVASEDSPFPPGEFPAFVMELTTRSVGVTTRARLTYRSAYDWSYDEFDSNGKFLRSQHLENNKVTINTPPLGRQVYPAGVDLTVPTDWFIDSESILALGGRRLGTSMVYERKYRLGCGANDPRCGSGMSFLTVTERTTFDRGSGIPIGYSERINGVPVMAMVATRLTIE